MNPLVHARSRRSRRGIVLYMSVLTVVVMAGMSMAIVTVGLAARHQGRMTDARARALSAAEAAVGDAFVQIAGGGAIDIGSANAPRAYSGDAYYGTVVENADKTYTILGVGQSGSAARALEVTVDPGHGGVFQNAIFAGNSSNDPGYVMKFGGKSSQADVVKGDVYSGGSILFKNAATIAGVPRATTSVTTTATSIVAATPGGTPAPAETGVKQPIPDLAAMHYETSHDVNVAHEFLSATYATAPAGGKAWQLPKTNPAHIFRMNPNDRTSNTSSTAKNDYFLEDPFESMHSDSSSDGSDPFRVRLSDTSSGGTSGNKKVYYIDGNLWLHNLSTMSFRLETGDSSGVQVTFVVKGNIYVSDNLYLKDKHKDGVAFIAMKDPAVTDSGNVYFGDPTFGTLEHMESYFYAENNFYDNNLDESGSAKVDLLGNMTAGNQVLINRDWGSQHSRLRVTFDDRVAAGALDLPGLPKSSGETATPSIRIWREVGVP